MIFPKNVRLFGFLIFQIYTSNAVFSLLPVFNDQITLTEFGTTTNQNISLQPANQYTVVGSMRTNDYQTMQLNFGDYASGRYPYRLGLFNVSESANTVGTIPFGTQLTLPAYVLAGSQSQNIEPNRYIEQIRNPSFIVYSFDETLDTIENSFTESETGLVGTVTYEHSATEYMINRNVPWSAYHDIQYEDVTPKLVFGGGKAVHIELNDTVADLPTSGTSVTLTPSTKFKFVIQTDDPDPSSNQIWLIYAQSPVASTSIEFIMTYEITTDKYLKNITLTATAPFSGYLRTAAIVVSSPAEVPNLLPPRTTPDWQLATQLQSLPATPLSMFMLWPYQWTKDVGKQIIFNQEANQFISSYQTVSLILPLLARSYPTVANQWFNQLIDKQTLGQTVFDIGTNSFVSLVNMMIAKYYDSDIQSFQSSIARGVSLPDLGISPDAGVMEQMFDDHRSEVPISFDLEFNLDGSYQIDISTMDVYSTFPTGASSLLLFSFPGYQTLADGFNIINNATNKDPIKGDINYVECNIGDVAGSFTLKFKNQSLPDWSERFIPDDFWSRLKGLDKTNLICQLNTVLAAPLPNYIDDTYDQGKILFQLAMTVKYATYVLLAQQGYTPPYSSGLTVPSSIKSRIQPLVTIIENVLSTWLISREYSGQTVSNYLVGDDLGVGIVAVKGTTSSTGGDTDSGNAVYTGHNRQYGYFLAAAAIAIETDRLFGNTPWIASTETNASSFSGTVKQFVDMLWRDYANPSFDDSDFMPYYRYGNPWEGLSSSKGMPPTGAYPSRNNASISEDFNGYYGSYLYARQIEEAPFSEIPGTDQQGFDGLEAFSTGNLNMIMRSARALFYNNGNWVYQGGSFDFNLTTGTQWDNLVTSDVNETLGTPPAVFSKEGALYSEYKFDLFCSDLVSQFNQYCQSQSSGCSCQK